MTSQQGAICDLSSSFNSMSQDSKLASQVKMVSFRNLFTSRWITHTRFHTTDVCSFAAHVGWSFDGVPCAGPISRAQRPSHKIQAAGVHEQRGMVKAWGLISTVRRSFSAFHLLIINCVFALCMWSLCHLRFCAELLRRMHVFWTTLFPSMRFGL